MDKRRIPGLGSSVLLLFVALLAGCGVTGGAGANPTSHANSQASPTPSASSQQTPSGPPTNGVSLRMDVPTAAGGNLQVTITNNLTRAIHYANHNTNCTVIQLQKQNAATWDMVGACKLMSPTVEMELAAGQTDTVSLGGNWAAGTYRAALRYRIDASTADIMVYSAPATLS